MSSKDETLSPLGKYEEGMPWNPVEKVILERRSIRAFKKEPLPDSMIKRILEAGRYAPSAGNMQPWKFIVVNSPEILAEMEKDAQKVVRFFMFLLDYTRGNIL
ncbi:MAG: nitroreductase family protein, partial [Smithella sp.]|nr:nitroreductase family protein [Smithella sp.]